MHALYRRRSEVDDSLISDLVELSLSPYTRVRRYARLALPTSYTLNLNPFLIICHVLSPTHVVLSRPKSWSIRLTFRMRGESNIFTKVALIKEKLCSTTRGRQDLCFPVSFLRWLKAPIPIV